MKYLIHANVACHELKGGIETYYALEVPTSTHTRSVIDVPRIDELNGTYQELKADLGM